jgi:hypothetical protein
MTAGPFQQLHAQFLFQLLDGAAEGRLGEMEALGGSPEVEFFGDSDKAADLSQFHEKLSDMN